MKLHPTPSFTSLERLIDCFEGDGSSTHQVHSSIDTGQDPNAGMHTINPAPAPPLSPDSLADPAGTSFYALLNIAHELLCERKFDLSFGALETAATFPDMPAEGPEVLLQRIDEWMMLRRAIPPDVDIPKVNDYRLINQRREKEEEFQPAWDLRREITDKIDRAAGKISSLNQTGCQPTIPHPISYAAGDHPRDYKILFEHLDYRLNYNVEYSQRHPSKEGMDHYILSCLEDDFLKISAFLDSQGKQQPLDKAEGQRLNKVYAYAYLLHARLCEQRILYWEGKYPPDCPRVGSVWTSIQHATQLNPDLKKDPWVRFYNEGQPAGIPFYKQGDFKFLAWAAGMGALGYFSVTNGIHSTHPELIAAIGVPFTFLTILYGRRSLPAFPDLKRAVKKGYLIPAQSEGPQHAGSNQT